MSSKLNTVIFPKKMSTKYIEELKRQMIYIISISEKNQKDKLGEKTNSFMICVQDYWLIVCWYLIIACEGPFLKTLDEIIDICENEWGTKDCYNLKEDIMSNLMDLSEEKFHLMSILENSESSFYYFNIPFFNKCRECNTWTILKKAYIFELYGVEKENSPIHMSFCYLLGLSLYFYILEKSPELIEDYRKKFDITEEDCSAQFSDSFVLALIQFTDYNIETICLKKQEKYTRYFENLTSKLCVKRNIAKEQKCPCGSNKKYKDCCEKKELKWVTINGKINKQLPLNDIASASFKTLLSQFSKSFGRNTYSYEPVFKILGFGDGVYENLVSKIIDEDLSLDKQYAILKTGMIVSEYNYNQFSDLGIKEWKEAIKEFQKQNTLKKYNGKSIFEIVKEANTKLKKLNENIENIDCMMNMYLNKFPINYNFSNLMIENQTDFSMICARKIVIDTNILLSVFNHKSVEEATNITRIIFEDLIQTEILLKDEEIFKEKILPLTLLEKGLLEYKKNTKGEFSKNRLIDPKTGKEYNIKINIKDISLKSTHYKKIYDDIFDVLSSFIHLSVKKIPRYFNIPNPLMEVQEYKTICLLGLFLLNQCVFEMKENIKMNRLLLRDMEYIYNKNCIYINKCLKILLLIEPHNEIYEHIIKIQKNMSPNAQSK